MILCRLYSIKICFCEVMIAVSVKPCIVTVLDILFKHALWPVVLNLDYMLQWLSWLYVDSSIKLHFSVVVEAASVKPSIVIVFDILYKHTLCPWLRFQWLCPMQVRRRLPRNSCWISVATKNDTYRRTSAYMEIHFYLFFLMYLPTVSIYICRIYMN